MSCNCFIDLCLHAILVLLPIMTLQMYYGKKQPHYYYDITSKASQDKAIILCIKFCMCKCILSRGKASTLTPPICDVNMNTNIIPKVFPCMFSWVLLTFICISITISIYPHYWLNCVIQIYIRAIKSVCVYCMRIEVLVRMHDDAYYYLFTSKHTCTFSSPRMQSVLMLH